MTPTLVFVYNAGSGLLNGLADLAHKTFSPETYGCQLCALTYSPFGMRRDWKDFLERLPVQAEFLHADELQARYGLSGIPLPAVFERRGKALLPWLSAAEIDGCRTLDALQRLITRKLEPPRPSPPADPMEAQPIVLRPATLADLPLLRHWDEQPHVLASDPNHDWEWEAELATSPDWRELLIAERDARPIGFVQLIDPAREESHYWGDVPENLRALDIWIGEAADLGQGYGTAMMHLALQRCFADPGVSAVLIDPLSSNTRAHRFYERLGFRFVERRRFGGDDCFVYRLDRAAYAPPS